MSVCTIDVGLELRKANEEGFRKVTSWELYTQ